MVNPGAEEEKQGMEKAMVVLVKKQEHPYAFHVSGPRNMPKPNWRDLINSSWKDANYKRIVIACFIQAVYLLELDRQESRPKETALAPNWWITFNYKLARILIDERDGSIFGAILEWDRSAALANFVLVRPRGAPKAILALRGTLLKGPTIRRDIEDDLRFLAWESLKGSVRFKVALEALKVVADRYGSNNVCVAGHSLGAGFALQVGKALAKEGIYVDAHLFNPPSISLAMSLRYIGEKAGLAWNLLKSMLHSSSEPHASNEEIEYDSFNLKNWLGHIYGEKTSVGLKNWVPHLYVNNRDYICYHYIDPKGIEVKEAEMMNIGPTDAHVAAKLFVVLKPDKQEFLEAHRLEQWWSEELDLQLAPNEGKLISRQLKSLYRVPATQQTQGRPR